MAARFAPDGMAIFPLGRRPPKTSSPDRDMAMDNAKWFGFEERSHQRHRDGVTPDTVGLAAADHDQPTTPDAAGKSGAMSYSHSLLTESEARTKIAK